MSKLFSPIEIRGETITNRVFVSPTCQYTWETEDGPCGGGLSYCDRTGLYGICAVIQRKKAVPMERLGHRPAILGCNAWKGGGYLTKVE